MDVAKKRSTRKPAAAKRTAAKKSKRVSARKSHSKKTARKTVRKNPSPVLAQNVSQAAPVIAANPKPKRTRKRRKSKPAEAQKAMPAKMSRKKSRKSTSKKAASKRGSLERARKLRSMYARLAAKAAPRRRTGGRRVSGTFRKNDGTGMSVGRAVAPLGYAKSYRNAVKKRTVKRNPSYKRNPLSTAFKNTLIASGSMALSWWLADLTDRFLATRAPEETATSGTTKPLMGAAAASAISSPPDKVRIAVPAVIGAAAVVGSVMASKRGKDSIASALGGLGAAFFGRTILRSFNDYAAPHIWSVDSVNQEALGNRLFPMENAYKLQRDAEDKKDEGNGRNTTSGLLGEPVAKACCRANAVGLGCGCAARALSVVNPWNDKLPSAPWTSTFSSVDQQVSGHASDCPCEMCSMAKRGGAPDSGGRMPDGNGVMPDGQNHAMIGPDGGWVPANSKGVASGVKEEEVNIYGRKKSYRGNIGVGSLNPMASALGLGREYE